MTEPFTRHLCRIIVAQICKQMGFQAIKASASEALVDLLIRYVEEIGTRSHDFAELAGRTECNFMDVKQTFSDLNIKINDLITFVNTDDVQFPVAVPDFPLKSSENSTNENKQQDSLSKPEPLPSYVPEHLPPFPDPHSWKQTPTYSTKKIATGADARQARKSKVRERRHVQDSLAKLNEKIGSKPIFNYETAKNSIGNPYLAPPEIPREPLTQTLTLPQTPQYNPQTPATPSQFASDLQEDTTASYVSPTPLRKDSAFYRTVLQTKPFDEADSEEPKRVMNTDEEAERYKKRQRAEQILKLDTDIVDT